LPPPFRAALVLPVHL